MIIGVCGTFASGKDAVAKYLAAKGFEHVSTGDLLREYIKEHQLGGLQRDNLRVIANKTRLEKGGGYFVNLALSRHERPMVVSGLRSSIEVEALKAAGGVLIAVDAPITKRFSWAKARRRLDDDGVKTAEDFKRMEAAEESSTPTDCQITTVISMANFNISNDGTLTGLHAKVDAILMRHNEMAAT